MVLKIEKLQVSYGGLRALSEVSLEVGQGEFVAVVGPNGAGKTTLFKSISGTVPVESGRITLDGADLLAVPPARRAHLGLAHVPEGRQVFSSMTVLENLEMGAHTAAGKANWEENIAQIYQLFPRLKDRTRQLAGTLSGGEQQMLAIGRGLASAPRILMLDEPSLGLAPAVADDIFEVVQHIHQERGLAILLVEQRVAEALESCDRGYVLESGRTVLTGTHETLVSDRRVQQSYLGM
ncbi:MAG: ABC transporter ATP-binding protein [Candidatus Lambdaproteobacteria bacterium]|nr:ABC transporter ATP-binding protein [Candidatus Lambdaproteobacteria bacterium]